MKITNILHEAAGPKVGRKYQHIEDLVLSNGSVGGLHAVERLKHMADQGGSIELKWDGMPVVYWGRDEKGNFSMIPKNAWAYLKSGKTQTSSGAPTVMNSPEDVKAFVLGTGGGDPKARQAFANQFASLWPYFEKISPKQGYLEGGLLFYPGTKPDGTTAMPVLNKETNTYDFTPNITTFHIPVDSDLGKQIAKSKVMVAATGYYPALGSSDEQRFPDAQQLSVPGVIVQGTTYVQEPVKMDTQGLANLEAFIKKNAKLIDNYLAPKPGLSNPGGELYAYANKHLRTEGLLRDFPEWAKANMSEKKAQMMLADPKGLQATLGAVEGITNQKNALIGQLSQGLHGGIKQTKPEGYAQAHPGAKFKYDIPGQFIKAIDQTNWKPRESVMEKTKQASKPIVVGWGRGMGHTGHDALASAVIHAAQQQNATPAFFVSRSFGKDDPIPPETKVAMYKKKFPKYAPIFRLPSPEKPTINDVLADLAAKGFTDATLVVGADQKDAFGYLTRPDKSGVPPYQKFGFDSFNVISRQETGDPLSDPKSSKYHEGPRATPMRQVLMDPSKSEEEQFQVWRQSMSPALSDEEVLQMMHTAKENLTKFNMPKPKVKKASELKEFIERVKKILPEFNQHQKKQIFNMLSEAKKQLNESTNTQPTFAGKDPMSFKSPKGGTPTMMIVTGQGSRYLITSDGMVLRNKSFHANTGGEDQGMKDWSDAIEFYNPDELPGGATFPMSVAKAVEKRLPITLSKTQDGRRALLIHDGSQWRIAKISDVYKHVATSDDPIVSAFSTTPKLNWNVLDYNLNSNKTLRSAHPGSPVTHGVKLQQSVAGVKEGIQSKVNEAKKESLLLKNALTLLQQKYPNASFNIRGDRVESDDGELTIIGTEHKEQGYIGCSLWDVATGPYTGCLVPAIKQTTEQLLQKYPKLKPALFLEGDNENPDAWENIAGKLGYTLIDNGDISEVRSSANNFESVDYIEEK